MSQERLMKILVAPHVTEKATIVADAANQYVFKVSADADKAEIKKAVELMFNVQVDSVQVANVQGKRKRFGAMQGRRKGFRKAYVRVKEGQSIDFTGAAE